jgi:predicted alpha/beta-hydrolase family hydrolase
MWKKTVDSVNEEVGGCIFKEKTYPLTVAEARDKMSKAGMKSTDITQVCGTLARLGWNNAILAMWNHGYRRQDRD